MSSDPDVLHLLGKIDGKLDQVIDSAKEHRADDQRRFTDVYAKLGQHDKDIEQAKGAKSVILWLAGGGALAISALVSFLGRAKGGG